MDLSFLDDPAWSDRPYPLAEAVPVQYGNALHYITSRPALARLLSEGAQIVQEDVTQVEPAEVEQAPSEPKQHHVHIYLDEAEIQAVQKGARDDGIPEPGNEEGHAVEQEQPASGQAEAEASEPATEAAESE